MNRYMFMILLTISQLTLFVCVYSNLIAFLYFPQLLFHLRFYSMINIICLSLYAMISLLFIP